MDIEKAARGERARIEALLAKETARVRRAFRAFLASVTSEAVRRELRRALEREGVAAALDVLDAHIVRLSGVLTTVFQASASAEVAALATRMATRQSSVALAFDPAFPRAAAAMRTNRLGFVREFSRAQRETTRAALTEALQSGAGPVQVARSFRDSIGLTETQRRSVANYRRLLEAGDAAALTRDLRDRRFDASVRRAAAGGDPLGAKKINRMVEQYRARYLQYRAEVIARTETLRTINLAQREGLEQVLDQTGLTQDRVVRVWRATLDARTRDTHAAMDGQRRAIDQPFDSPSGAQLMYPGDPAGGAAEVINCRCVLLNDVSPP